jgi:GTPase SAR1 family protein
MIFTELSHAHITFVIGLPGSGKSYLLNYLKENPFIEPVVYDDWLIVYENDCGNENFNCDGRYPELIENLNNKIPCIISSIKFLEPEFLNSSITTLIEEINDLKIEYLYFDNDIESCKFNVKCRDIELGGYWKPNNEGILWYYGTIYNNKPLYLSELSNIENLSSTYEIPTKYTPIKIERNKNITKLPFGYE